ncbi:transcriptional regulator [Brachybacterium vulturis]|uniref:Transcriptional regulator n=1 Tax=Brachybacterium vulturis TaxID=2017484 RepID=A0A291GT30_9MICO|nr:transcriptional regulator [Brachybacterium vulturis]
MLALVIVLAWGTGLTVWSNSRIDHVPALSGAEDTPGTTYLIAGSDRRDGEAVDEDGTTGARADTMMLLHKAPGGNSYLVSLPRDTLVEIPGYGGYKLNAAYSFGGAPLLVETVEEFTGLTVDHYVEIGFDGVSDVVDSVGHVNLCIDQDVDDEKSGLVMAEGCHDVGGEQALAFVRARYFDPTADLGRQQRQQQFVGALMERATSPSVMLNPVAQVRLAGAGSGALTTSEDTGILDVGRMALTARGAMNAGSTPTIPIEDPQYRTEHSGVAILTDDEDIAAFFAAVGDGSAETSAK